MQNALRTLGIGLVPIVFASCTSPGPAVPDLAASASVPLGTDLGSSSATSAASVSGVPPGEGHERTTDLPSGVQMAYGGHNQEAQGSHNQAAQGGHNQLAHAGHNDVHGAGTVNSVDPAGHKLQISHDPIPTIGWPAMTMEFPVAPSVDLRSVKPGMRVNFTIEQAPGGMYEIRSLSPAGGAR